VNLLDNLLFDCVQEYVMASKIRKPAAAVVAHPRLDETPVGGAGVTRVADGVDAKTASETPPSRNAWPAEFGWDFPFDFPKLTR
jgi:hypothetical protein